MKKIIYLTLVALVAGCATPVDRRVESKLDSIRIPKISFHQTPVTDVVAFLQEASVKNDTGPSNKRGVNFVLFLDPSSPLARAEVPLLTFSERDISLRNATVTICGALGLQWRVENAVVLIEWGEEIGFTLDEDTGPTSPRTVP